MPLLLFVPLSSSSSSSFVPLRLVLLSLIVIFFKTTTVIVAATLEFKPKFKQLLNQHHDNNNINNNHYEFSVKTRSMEQKSIESNHNYNNNNNDSISSTSCEIQYIECLLHPKCYNCFQELLSNDIDWTIIGSNTNCYTILSSIESKLQKCLSLSNDKVEQGVFCNTFDSCVIFNNDGDGIHDNDDNDLDDVFMDDIDSNVDDDDKNENENGNNNNGNKKVMLNCDSLTTCDFEGFNPNYIGDGICQDYVLNGCYNTKVCGYDGGDCCPDTCQSKNEYIQCGTDGYVCKDPKSTYYNKNGNGDNNNDIKPRGGYNCTKDEIPLKLLQYDSFGNGWDTSSLMEITKLNNRGSKNNNERIIYVDRLQNGYEGSEILCFPKEPSCYSVVVNGGSWGNDISWQIKSTSGSRDIAAGASHWNCQFSLYGDTCDNTCVTGKSNVDLSKDNSYQSFDTLSKCMQDKCIIQFTACSKDGICSPCLSNDPPPYCLSNGNYTALVFCTQCNCVSSAEEPERMEFCSAKSKKGASKDKNGNDGSRVVVTCDWEELKEGIDALRVYSECSNIADTDMLTLFEYDNDNFGLLDEFESCARQYLDNKHDKSALECMQILQDAIDNPAGTINGEPTNKDGKLIPTKAIKAIANDLLNNGHDFCDCSFQSFKKCPACQDFIQFKTLLYESVDACDALDNIDCGAWQEFSRPCKANIVEKFKKIDFKKKDQCKFHPHSYIHSIIYLCHSRFSQQCIL